MGNNKAEVIFQIRLPVDRRMAVNRRLFLRHEFLDHNPERRLNIITRRMHGDRRCVVSEILHTFGKQLNKLMVIGYSWPLQYRVKVGTNYSYGSE